MHLRSLEFGLLFLFLAVQLGCSGESESEIVSDVSCGDAGCDGDADSDADGDADNDADGDADNDADTDADNDADADADGDADNDADTDADNDADTDADNDADTDADNDADGDADNDADGDADNDADTDADNDADGDADNDADGDADNDTDTDADGDTDTDADNDTDSDTDTDADSDTDTDADGDVPALSCDIKPYGAVNIPGANVISDFETEVETEQGPEYMAIYQQGGRGGPTNEAWYAYAAGDQNDDNGEMNTPGQTNPESDDGNTSFEVISASGPCGGDSNVLHVKSPGNTEWGVGWGVNFRPRDENRRKQTYDASEYTGIGFMARCTSPSEYSGDAEFMFFKIPDANEDADVALDRRKCDYDGQTGTTCNQHGIKNAVITKDWNYYKVYFNDALHDTHGERNDLDTPLDVNNLTGFQLQVNLLDDDGATAPNAFECWVDNVHFLSEEYPAETPENPDWSVSGNTLTRGGQSGYLIKGLARPSMEWDRSGNGLTREDVMRMKSWGINTVRLAVEPTDFLPPDTKASLSMLLLDRYVRWVKQEGMDIIIDNHLIEGSPQASSGGREYEFWSLMADKYGNDGRVLFELYNEPTADCRNEMQSLVDMIRGKGAKNLTLVGGPDWAFDLRPYEGTGKLNDDKTIYVTHPYIWKWGQKDEKWGNVPNESHVIATEFGNADVSGAGPDDCNPSDFTTAMNEFNTRGMSYTGWAWHVDQKRCSFPALIDDWEGTPNPAGQVVKDSF